MRRTWLLNVCHVRKNSGHKALNLLLCEMEIFENSSLNQGKCLEKNPTYFCTLWSQLKSKGQAISICKAELNLERGIPDSWVIWLVPARAHPHWGLQQALWQTRKQQAEYSSDGAFQHGVTGSKFKHRRHISKIQSRMWMLQLSPDFSRSAPSFQEPRTWRAAHWASCKHHAAFVAASDGRCFVAIERQSLGMSRRFRDTKPKQSATYTVLTSLVLHLAPIGTLNKLFCFLTGEPGSHKVPRGGLSFAKHF